MVTLKSADRANAKRTKLLDDDSDASSSADEAAVLPLTVNKEYAARFEYNKKREERQRLEEKYGDSAANKRKRLQNDISDDEDDSTDEEEDDDAELATADVDEEIFATLNAIKNKDPKVYDASVKFFRDFDPDTAAAAAAGAKKAEKPMYLSDYHRKNILAKSNGDLADVEEEAPMQTYQQEQDALKQQLVGAMHAANEAQDGEEDDFLVAKSKSRHENMPLPKRKKITDADIKAADADPETFLSNFMQARAWLPGEGTSQLPFESDDSEDDARADEFEEAYNMRFENPQVSNEKLQSFARDVGKYGARREAKTGRQLAREREKERKDAAKRERDEDKARLRKLKIEEAEEKVKKIKEAAGLQGEELDVARWREVLEDDFDDDTWETEMKRRFGEEYYAQNDNGVDADGEESGQKHKVKKPKWDDDIDIEDLVPDFDAEEKPTVTLSSDEDESDDGGVELPKKKKAKTSSSDAKRAARKERRKIEEIVDAALPVHLVGEGASAQGKPSGFRYRETSPTTFGLSARDILFADDTQLNEFAGLKKMAAFRDEEKKRRDKKKFSKKARLKKWRKDTFGTDVEPTGGFERILGGGEQVAAESNPTDGDAGKKKRKHKKSKTAKSEKA